MIPCDPIGYLNSEYGNIINWMKPKEKDYSWNNIEEVEYTWSDQDWTNAIKFYQKNGKLDRDKTLKYINEALKAKLEDLPF